MTSGTQPTAKVLRVGILAPVRTLDPNKSRDSVSNLAISQIFDTPYALPLRGEETLRPRLFDGPLVSEGGLVLSGRLARGACFSDGTPVSASHVAGCLGRLEEIAEQARVEADGERVVFHLHRPNPRFDLSLTLVRASITRETTAGLIGSGAFRPAPGGTLEALRLVPNPHARRAVALDEVVFQVYPPNEDGSPEALVKAVESGDVDFTTMLSRNDATAISGVRKAFRPSNATAILHMNTARAALAGRQVRQAIAHAIDRRALTELAYSNVLAFVATSLIPPGMGTTPDKHPHDLERARSLLGQAGALKPSRLDLLITWAPRPYIPNPHPVATLIARQLAPLGIDVVISHPKDANEYFRRQEAGDYDMILAGWIADTPDPADFLEANLHSDRIPRPGVEGLATCNLSRLKDADMDAALDHFRLEPTPDNLDKVLTRVADSARLLPIMYGPTVVVSAFRVQNVEVPPLGFADFGGFDIDA